MLHAGARCDRKCKENSILASAIRYIVFQVLIAMRDTDTTRHLVDLLDAWALLAATTRETTRCTAWRAAREATRGATCSVHLHHDRAGKY